MMEATSTAMAQPETAQASSRPLLAWLGMLGGVFLGCVLLFAVWAKALDPAAFAEQIHAEGLDFALPAQAIALIALALEAGLGLALVLGVRRSWVLVPAALLVAFFLSLTGRAWWLAAHGLRPDTSCGCFGNLIERTPAEAFWQDLLLLVPPLLLAFLGRDRGAPRFPKVRTALAAAGALLVVGFAWKAPGLPLDDLATRLRPDARVNAMCAGSGEQRACLDAVVPELREGDHLVVISNLDDKQLTGAIDALNAYAGKAGNPSLWVLAAVTPEQRQAFFWQWGPAFQIRETPAAMLRPLYRRLPRAFMVKDGRVTRTFAGMPPLAAAPKDSLERSSK
ncbi:MAG TPA: MauE/DoxX family redox-associated membrane protein [Thermoanaerobaculia bacterium]